MAVAAGWWHSLGLKADGSIVAWESNYDDYGNYMGQCNVPSPNTGFIAVTAGEYHSLGLKADGSVVAWGDNGDGQCNVPSPNTGFVAIAAGWWHSLGLKADCSIVAWGWNGISQCNVPSPNTGFAAVAAGGLHSLALTATKPTLGVVNKERIDRTKFIYDCNATFTNLWPFAVKNVELQMIQTPENMTIIDPIIKFGNIEFQTRDFITSTDICTFQVDRFKPIDPSQIDWRMKCQRVDTGMPMELTINGVGSSGLESAAEGKIGFEDLAELAGQWFWVGPAGSIPEDITGDGIVNLRDFAVLAERWLE